MLSGVWPIQFQFPVNGSQSKLVPTQVTAGGTWDTIALHPTPPREAASITIGPFYTLNGNQGPGKATAHAT